MKTLHWIAAALMLGAFSGCETDVTQKDVNEQKNVVADRERRVAELEQDKPREVQQAAEEAQERKDKELAEAKKELAEEKQQLIATENRQKFEDDMELKLQEMDKQIDEVEAQAAKAEGEEKVKLEAKAAAMRTRYDNLRKDLDELKAASGDTWSNLKLSVEKAWNDATNAVNTATDDSDAT